MNFFQGFVGPAYEAPSRSVNEQRTINMLFEVAEANPKVPSSLIGVPGLRELGVIGGGTSQNYLEVNGIVYAAVGQSFGRVNKSGDTYSFEVLGSYSGKSRITMIDNGLQVLVIDGLSGFVYQIDTMAWTQITDPGYVYGATQATYQDGYGIVALPDSQQFGISGLYDFLTWDAIDFASAEGLPDNVSTVVSNHRLLHVFGTGTLELFYNSGAAAFPFTRVDGAFYEIGCSAPYSAVIADDSVFWLGNNAQGALAVYRMQGQSPLRISTLALEKAFADYSRVDDAFGVGLDIQRHPIYMLVFPTEGKTWCYDAHSSSWFEWLEWTAPDWKRTRINCFAKAFGQLLVGDYRDGRMYALDFNFDKNGSDPLRTLRHSPYVWKNNLRLFHSRLELLIEPGVGLLDNPDTDATDPKWSMRWSEDGFTWSNELSKPMGKFGQYQTRCIFNRLGSARNRVYEFSSTSPVKRVILGATVEVTDK